jgi:glycerol kinase
MGSGVIRSMADASHILAIDQGTTSSRAIVFDADGQIAAAAQQEFAQHFPRSGWVEHDANEIWQTQLAVMVQAMEQAKLSASDLAGIGITNQRETTVVWDRNTGQPIHRAIVWQDRRTAPIIAQLKADGCESTIRQKTGLVLDPYFSGTKAAWLLDHVPGARNRAAAGELAFGTIDSWLIYKLTGGALHLTDATNASRTMLLNIHTGEWDDELLAMLNVPRAMLPEVKPSSHLYGQTTIDDLPGVAIAGVAGDQQAALFGQMCLQRGMVKNTYGTGCFTLMTTGPDAVVSQNKLLTTIAWQRDDSTAYALEGSVFIGGAVVQWLRDGLGIIESSADIEPLARQVPDTGGVYFVPAFTGLGAPQWDSSARGTICGLTRATTKAHLARAALEAIAFQVADLIDAMKADADLNIPELRVDGGAAANDLLLQIQADLMQTPIARPSITETTALGAAYLAGLATGFWTDTDQLQSNWQLDQRFDPQRSADEVAAMRAQWNRAVERARDWETSE